ncbi:RhoGAP domain-containing protein [Providencia vermicola]|uniref:RhoGAP domain-containing protein n=1 Tax=Providencia TaxID=586 RepID=UPI0013A78496|nr:MULTISPECIES: RhoGAP domain-containing protein [Providencia]ELR5120243.1 hypothetical protein [Providencia stuartii]ELR5123372.1 hypothetical protein [Providencia stuartii]QIC16352.1 hypothetical protein G3341_11960 [Providencia vermicola]
MAIKTSNTPINNPVSLIESVFHHEQKGFLASIRKIINCCKSYFGIPAQYQHELIEQKNKSIEPISIKRLDIQEQESLLPPSHYKTFDELQEMESRITQQQTAKRIEKQNVCAINEYIGIAYEDRLKYQQINEIGTAILSHPNYLHETGPFRISGNKQRVEIILQHLASNKSIDSFFIQQNNIEVSDLTSAYKKLVGNVLDGSSSERKTLSTLFTKYHDAVVNKATVKRFIETKPTLATSENHILAVSDTKIADSLPPLKKQPLILQIAVPLLIEIGRHAEKHQMTPENLSIAFAPTLDRTDYSKTTGNPLDQLKQIELAQLPIHYFSALLHR